MKMNHAIKILIASDFGISAGFALFMPVFAIFLTDQIIGGTAAVVGFAAAIAQITKSSLQIPVARYLDKNHGEFDDFYAMIIGSFIIASVPFMYLLASQASHIYIIQVAYGIGAALAIPPWYAIFTRHIDKLMMNVEWSMESVAIGVSGAGAAALSGLIVDRFGFSYAFILGGLLSYMGAAVQVKLFKDLKGYVRPRTVKAMPNKKHG